MHPGRGGLPGALLGKLVRQKAVRSGFWARNGLCSSFLAPVTSDCKSLSHLFFFPHEICHSQSHLSVCKSHSKKKQA